jgi:chloramphenicol 3-O-phosphotransferase
MATGRVISNVSRAVGRAGPIVLITGAMAAGKSSVAQALAERMSMSVHLRGDAFRRMVVSGRVEMSANPEPEALRQLRLRYEAASQTAKLFSAAGFSVAYQDVVVGPVLKEVVAMYEGFPLHVVVLCPRADVLAEREQRRAKRGYDRLTVEQMLAIVEGTPRIGLWVDNSDQSVHETVDAILAGLNSAKVSRG